MAAYNGGKYLREQLDSILAQTYRDFLLYIRDDGSTDDTPQILAQYAAQDSRIRMVADTVKHRGCSGSFRYLTETVDADCYLFSDQDDVWLPEKVERTLDRLRAFGDSTPAAVHTDLQVVDESLKPLHPSFFRLTHREPEKASRLAYTCAYPTVTGCTAAFNRRARDLMVAAPPVHCLHDRLLSLVVTAAGGTIDWLPEATVLYRQHSSNVLGATAERSAAQKLSRIRASWRDNRQWYDDVRAVTGISAARFIAYKIRYMIPRLFSR